ncbi:bifunctional DNA primase/polymerase [Streptomyces hokutonensis]|uniref:bifunctional DNA primase/polymerase n=1 Tax=Streptomyces hokutonensis TaxID=1306990 RepID=UPI0037F3341B
MSDTIRDAALRALRDGLAVVLIRPGQKAPLCPLSAAEGKRADDVVRAEARSAGDARWGLRKHACGLHCALTDETSLISALARLAKNGVIPNLAIETGRSRVVVVDVDTAAEKDAFLTAWTEATGEHMTSEPPTVTSPGAKGAEGTWKHKDGGHYWFRVPEGDDLPTGGPGVIKAPGGGSLLWRDRYVLIPPSERSEGAYRWTGEIRQLLPWLREFIEKKAAETADRTPSGEIRNGDPVDDWAAGVPWAGILAPDGWTDTGKADNCGCPIWTAPGNHDSPKSATAHEVGCTYCTTEGGQAPLHIWTDNVPECAADAVEAHGRSISKLTYVAFRDHDGDMGEAMAELGIDDEGPDDFAGMLPDGAQTEGAPGLTAEHAEWLTDKAVSKEFKKITAQWKAQKIKNDLLAAQTSAITNDGRLVGAGDFALDEPETIPALWGEGDQVLAAEGEGFMICGHQGTGKSTLIQQFVLHRAGLLDGPLLGLLVKRDDRPTLILAMDRPRQIARSLRRMVTDDQREIFNARVKIWKGPLPFDVTASATALADWAEKVCPGVGLIVADSVKDFAPGISKDEVGAALNSAWQEVIAREIELGLVHHERKSDGKSSRTHSLDDVYGSTWLTSGLGSVLVLDGNPGEAVQELRHLKQPGAVVGPLTLRHDHRCGRTSIASITTDVKAVLEANAAIDEGMAMSAVQVAQAAFGKADTAEVQRARRDLDRLVENELAEVIKGRRGGPPSRWYLTGLGDFR